MGYVRRLLTWDGPPAIDVNRQPFDPSTDDTVLELTYGLLSVEPYRSNRDLFNIWYLEQPAPSPTAYGAERQNLPTDLSNTLVVTLAWDREFGAVATPPDFVPLAER